MDMVCNVHQGIVLLLQLLKVGVKDEKTNKDKLKNVTRENIYIIFACVMGVVAVKGCYLFGFCLWVYLLFVFVFSVWVCRCFWGVGVCRGVSGVCVFLQ